MGRHDATNQIFTEMSSDGANLAKVVATFCVVLVHSNNIFGYAQIENNNMLYWGGSAH